MNGSLFVGSALSAPKPLSGTKLAHQRTVDATPQRRFVVPVRSSLTAPPVELEVKAFEGEVVGSETLSLRVADPETAKGLVHRYLVKVRRDMRKGNASTKTRSEVQGGGRKPFPQKGRGAARRGSTRSPLIVGGGVIFGPRPRDWSVDMNKKERRLALATALQSAADDVIVTETLEGKFSDIKTKSVVAALERWGVSPSQYCLLITDGKNPDLYRAGRNIEKLQINSTEHINVYDILRADRIVIEQGALQYIQGFYGPKEEE